MGKAAVNMPCVGFLQCGRQKIPKGFLKHVNSPDFNDTYWAARALARAKPAKAAELLRSSDLNTLDKYFIEWLAEAIAERHPELYLQLNPDGTFEAIPSHSSGYDDWEDAVTQLAKTDPPRPQMPACAGTA